VLKAFVYGGATILFGTDSPQEFSVPGFSVAREMRANVAAGLTPYRVLRSAAKDIGEYMKAKDSFGLVVPGHRADLLLLDANPLADIGNIAKRSGVMLRGQWLPATDLDARLVKIAANP